MSDLDHIRKYRVFTVEADEEPDSLEPIALYGADGVPFAPAPPSSFGNVQDVFTPGAGFTFWSGRYFIDGPLCHVFKFQVRRPASTAVTPNGVFELGEFAEELEIASELVQQESVSGYVQSSNNQFYAQFAGNIDSPGGFGLTVVTQGTIAASTNLEFHIPHFSFPLASYFD